MEYKRQDKNHFFQAGNLGYTNMRSPLPSTRIDPFAFNSLAAWERKRIRFNGDISTGRYISTAEDRIARATLERAAPEL